MHTSVPGRLRLHIAGLRRSSSLQTTLERGLEGLPGIDAATASTGTGTLLVYFDPAAVSADHIMDLAAALVRGEICPRRSGIPGQGFAARPTGTSAVRRIRAAELGTSAQAGLSAAAAGERLAREGPNRLEQPPLRSNLEILLEQFRSLPVGLLAGAAVLSIVSGGAFESRGNSAVVALNGVIGYGVESRSERTISSLATTGDRTASVVRDGVPTEIGLEAVVPGDVITLRRGTLVPADARVIAAHDLTVSEAMLTGESFPVAKAANPLPRQAAPLGDRMNMVYRGTVVTGGSGAAIAVATGPHTEVGRIQRLLGEATTPETPMQRDLAAIGRQLVWLSLGVCGLVFSVGVLRGFAVLQMFRSAISLAVAAVPEGLPAIATTTLALGIEEMRRRDVLVRRLDAVETLASVRVICFDKTGTLTLNRMSVAAIACGRGERMLRIGFGGTILDEDYGTAARPLNDGFARLLQIAILCSETQIEIDASGRTTLNGSATENALVQLALDLGFDALALRQDCPKLSMQYRTETYRFMVTTHRQARQSEVLVAIKGSPAEVLGAVPGGSTVTSAVRSQWRIGGSSSRRMRSWLARPCASLASPASWSWRSRRAMRPYWLRS